MKDGGFIAKHLGSFCGGSIAGGILGINILFTGSPAILHVGFLAGLLLWLLKLLGVSIVAFCTGLFTAAGQEFMKNPKQSITNIKKWFRRKKKSNKLPSFDETFSDNHKNTA